MLVGMGPLLMMLLTRMLPQRLALEPQLERHTSRYLQDLTRRQCHQLLHR